jgi:DMSO reductase anchor subunit
VLEQYSIYVERYQSEQSRGETINGFFLTINTGGISAIALLVSEAQRQSSGFIFLCAAAITICVVWWAMLVSLSRWQLVQLETIQELEEHLPVKPFCVEWHDKIARQKSYLKIRVVKQVVPWIFVGLYVGLFFAAR